MPTTPRTRLAALALLVALLGVAAVAHGTLEPDPDRHRYPDNEHLAEDYGAHVGERAVLSGTVVETDPLVVREQLPGGAEQELTLTGVDADATRGDSVWFYGTVRPDRTVEVATAAVRAPWELRYMYVVSALGGLLVLGRFLRQWRFDRSRLAFVPRTGDRGGGR